MFNVQMFVNCGISFGIGCARSGWIFLGLVLILLFLLKKYVSQGRWMLIAGAACSNALDRFVFGGVRDWIRVPLIPLWFNAADMILVGAIILALIPLAVSGKLAPRS